MLKVDSFFIGCIIGVALLAITISVIEKDDSTSKSSLVKGGHAKWTVDEDGKPTFHLFKIESGKVVN